MCGWTAGRCKEVVGVLPVGRWSMIQRLIVGSSIALKKSERERDWIDVFLVVDYWPPQKLKAERERDMVDVLMVDCWSLQSFKEKRERGRRGGS